MSAATRLAPRVRRPAPETRGPLSGAARHTCFAFTHFLSHLTQVQSVMENTAGSNDVCMLLHLISDLSEAPH